MSLHAALDPSVLFGGLLVLLGIVVLLVSGRYVWRATAVFRATAVDTLTGVETGTLVRVAGTTQAADEDPLVAPFSGVECVAVRYSVAERRVSVPYVVPWYVTVHEATGATTFAVDTGRAAVSVVEPARTVTLGTDVVAEVRPDTDPPDRIADFERTTTNVPASTAWRSAPTVLGPLFRRLGLGTRRYVEQRAALGDDVTVVGRAGDDGIDPLVVSDRSATATAGRMAQTSLVGLLIGLFAFGVGAVVLSVA